MKENERRQEERRGKKRRMRSTPDDDDDDDKNDDGYLISFMHLSRSFLLLSSCVMLFLLSLLTFFLSSPQLNLGCLFLPSFSLSLSSWNESEADFLSLSING